MGFDDGRIVLNSDTGLYFTGQTVFGKLIFDQQKEKSFRGIYIKFKGSCKVHWQESHTRRVNGKSETYYVDHDSHEEYFNQKIYLIGSENGDEKIRPGHYEFEFQFMIPPQCPSSFEGDHGSIRYELKAVVDRSFKMDQEKKVAIRVIAPLDLNTAPNVKEPVQFQFDETYYCCCTSSGTMKALVKLPYGGYCPGQPIPIEVSCNNSSSVGIDSIRVSLKKTIKFHAQGTKYVGDKVAVLELGEVASNTSKNFTTELFVPNVDAPNVVNCRYIDIDYTIKVTISPDGCHSDSSDCRSIVIGTVPLVGSNYTPSLQEQMAQQNLAPNQAVPAHYPGAQPSPYPGASPYPGNASYPSNTPYPNAPYPSNTPYPTANPPSNSYPPPYSEVVSNTSYPGPAPYPTSDSPYPTKSPSVTPYPTSSPYPGSNAPAHYPAAPSPYPAAPSPYPPAPSPYPPSSPFPAPATGGTGLKTGMIGFTAQGDGKGMPPLPTGASVPYPTNSSPNPYAAASAPEPATPDAENSKPNLP